MRSSAAWKNRRLSATEEHPILINRNGKRKWMPIRELNKKTDYCYIRSSKCKVCNKIIPFYWSVCEYCNPAEIEGIGDKISKSKDRGKLPNCVSSNFKHYYKDILPIAEKYKKKGYRVIPIGIAIHDIIEIKNKKVIAIEIENKLPKKRKNTKYSKELKAYYDDIVWIHPEKQKAKCKAKRKYIIDNKW